MIVFFVKEILTFLLPNNRFELSFIHDLKTLAILKVGLYITIC